MLKKCKLCSCQFKTYTSTRLFCSRYCSSNHYKQEHPREDRNCVICNKKFNVIATSPKKLCSVKCSNKLFSGQFKGEGNPNFGKRHPNMYQHTDDGREKIRLEVKNHWKTNGRMKKHKQFLKRYKKIHGHYHLHSLSARRKISMKIQQKMLDDTYHWWTNSVRGYYTSTKTNLKEYYQSSYEKTRMEELDVDDSVLYWTKRHKIVIPYSGHHKYYPDFYIEYLNGQRHLEEIKGFINNTSQFIRKGIAAIKYCKLNNLVYIVKFPNIKNFKEHKHLLDIIYETI